MVEDTAVIKDNEEHTDNQGKRMMRIMACQHGV